MAQNPPSTSDKDNTAPSEDIPSGGADALTKLAREIARRDAMEGWDPLPHDSKLYFVEKGWKSLIINDDPAVETVMSLWEMERAFKRGVIYVFIPSDATVTIEGIEKVCERSGVTVSVLLEEG